MDKLKGWTLEFGASSNILPKTAKSRKEYSYIFFFFCVTRGVFIFEMMWQEGLNFELPKGRQLGKKNWASSIWVRNPAQSTKSESR